MPRLPLSLLSLIAAILSPLLSGNAAVAQEGNAPYFDGDRILARAEIKQTPIRLALDTGASMSLVFEPTISRLNVPIVSRQMRQVGNQSVLIGLTPPVDFSLFGRDIRTPLQVLVTSRTADIDGVLSWRDVTVPTMLIDGRDRRLRSLSQLPQQGWQHWKLDTGSQQLFFIVTQGAQPVGRVFVDTGAVCGLRLSPKLWEEWRQQNPNAKTSLESFRYFTGEPVVHEMAWSDRYALGDLTLHNVDVGLIPGSQADKAIDAGGNEFVAMIGIRALRQLRLIIDRNNKEVLTQSVSLVPDHNRLGALFVPNDAGALVAHVHPNSPADQVGIQDGDILLSIDGADFSPKRKETSRDPNRLVVGRAGKELSIAVERPSNGDADPTQHTFKVQLADQLP